MAALTQRARRGTTAGQVRESEATPATGASVVEEMAPASPARAVGEGEAAAQTRSSESIRMALPRMILRIVSSSRFLVSFSAISRVWGHVESECG